MTKRIEGLRFISCCNISSSGPHVEPGDEQPRFALEGFDQRYALGCARDVGHAVEARVTGNEDIVEAQSGKQFFRLFVLHEKHLERLQRLPPPTAIPLKEDRIAPEDSRHDERSNPPPPQFAQQFNQIRT